MIKITIKNNEQNESYECVKKCNKTSPMEWMSFFAAAIDFMFEATESDDMKDDICNIVKFMLEIKQNEPSFVATENISLAIALNIDGSKIAQKFIENIKDN